MSVIGHVASRATNQVKQCGKLFNGQGRVEFQEAPHTRIEQLLRDLCQKHLQLDLGRLLQRNGHFLAL